MSADAPLPTLGKPKTVKDAVINILSQRWPLSLKKVYFSVRKMGFNVSYQAAHKAVSELVTGNVLNKEGKEYRISYEWIGRLRDFSLSLDLRYSDIPVGTSMVFRSLKDMDAFVLKMMEKFSKSGDIKVNCSHWNFTWWPLLASREEYSILKDLPSPEKIYITCEGDGAVEKWCMNIYRKMGVNIKTGVNLEYNFDFIVYEDMIIQMYWPEELKKKMGNAFSVRRIEEIDSESIFSDIFESEAKIDVIVIKNRDVAESFRHRILRNF